MRSAATPTLVECIRGDYEEMPRLQLTAAQAARLWNLDLLSARAFLEHLVVSGYLSRTPDGRYQRMRP